VGYGQSLVVLGGSLSLMFARDWAGSITAALFALLVVCPFALLAQTSVASRRGQWTQAARLLRWAVLLHPTPWTRFGLVLSRARSADPQQGYRAALARIEATGTQKQVAFARLLLAQERRDWEALLSLSRAEKVEFSEAKPREIRALGELGRLEEMVYTYRSAERWLLLAKRHECLLFVCAFTGRLACVQHLLSRPRFAVDDEAKTFWLAATRLRADQKDKVARAMLQDLAETSLEARVRRSAAEQLERADRAAPLARLAQETERQIDALVHGGGQDRPPRLKWSTKAHVRGLLLLILVILIAALQRYYR
jgi:hypothetical protein